MTIKKKKERKKDTDEPVYVQGEIRLKKDLVTSQVRKNLMEFKDIRQWHPTPVLLPGKSHGQRSLVGYSPWGHSRTRLNNFTFYEPSTFVSNSTHTSNWVLTSQIGVTEIIETHKNLQNSF